MGRQGDALVVLAHSGTYNTSAPRPLNLSFVNARQLLNVGDWDRDGDGDLVIRARSGWLSLRLSNGHGEFGRPQQIGTGFDRVRLLSAVGDMTGDGYPDLMGQPFGGAMRIYPGRGRAGLGVSYVAHGAISASGSTASASGTATVLPTACCASTANSCCTRATGRVA